MRMAAAWAFPLGVAVAISTYTVPLVGGVGAWGFPGALGTLLASVVTGVLLVPPITVVGWGRSPVYDRVRRATPLFTAQCFAFSALFGGFLLWLVGISPPGLGLLPWTLAVACLAAVASWRYAVRNWERALGRGLTVEDPALAAEFIGICRRELADRELVGDIRAVVELSLASALLVAVESDSGSDPLREALEILDDLVASAEPVLAYFAASMLVRGMRLKAMRTGDEVGWDRALDLLSSAAARVADVRPEAAGAALAARSDRYAYAADRAGDEGSGHRLRRAAFASLEEAAVETPAHLDDYAIYRVEAALLAHDTGHPLRGDINVAIRDCRRSARRLLWVDSDQWAAARLALADLLALRARLAPYGRFGAAIERRLTSDRARRRFMKIWPGRAGWDLIRATWICMQLVVNEDVATGARARLPLLREELVGELVVPLPAAVTRQTGTMFANVFSEQLTLSRTDAAVVAARWADWAAARGDVAQAAEAAWCWVECVAADLRRRVLHDQEVVLADVQESFAQASAALVRAGRLEDAVVALELGRAVALTARMHRGRDGLEERLRAAGEPELADRWSAAERLIAESDRAVGGGVRLTDLSGVVSAEYAALVDHEGLVSTIGQLPGFDDIGVTTSYGDIRAAAADGPVVYVAATPQGGFALVASQEEPPYAVELPLLSIWLAEDLADRLRVARGEMDAEMPGILGDVWDVIVAPLASALPPGALVTLVALGRLGDVPLHAAGVTMAEDGVWRDRTNGLVFRYAPNARVLLRAQRAAREAASREARVLTVGVSTSAEGPLLHAQAESAAVHALFAPAAERPEPPGLDAVRRALDTCTVWHFACHGRYDPLEPVESTLSLADGRLTVRELFGRTAAQRRLAVLSACQTTSSAGPLPDEVVGFPAALLQLGVAGVVACQTDVDDHAAMFLVLAFFARLRTADSPPRALAEAQAWLRSATNDEIHAAFPTDHPVPTGDWIEPDAWRYQRPFASAAAWAPFTFTGA